MVKPIMYKPGMSIITDYESAFQIKEDGQLDYFEKARNNAFSFNKAMIYLQDNGYIVKADKKKEIRVYHPNGRIARFAEKEKIGLKDSENFLSRLTEDEKNIQVLPLGEKGKSAVKLLAAGNNVPVGIAFSAYEQAGFNYDPAVKSIEQRMGFLNEDENKNRRIPEENLEDILCIPIDEWADKEFIDANVYQSA
ncbi:hypothetical protein GOV06_04210 [Candidatus Woesearchaeota archaeon]|nr:hypothetical protein [Candidatus Woesearchaeota archaeon]